MHCACALLFNRIFLLNKMEDKNISSLIAALKLDEHPFKNQFMYLEEMYNADGSFILSAIIKYQIEKNCNIIFVLCHNSLGHFHSISQKLGYNLISLKESGRVYIIEVLEKVLNENFLTSTESLRELYNDIKKQLDVWESKWGVCVIVENIGDLLLAEIPQFFTFIHYLRAITQEKKNSSLLISMHGFKDNSNVESVPIFQNSSCFEFITKSIRYIADVIITLRDLQTGKANDITGYLTVTRRKENHIKSTVEYQYQLQDKSINVFTPGASGFL